MVSIGNNLTINPQIKVNEAIPKHWQCWVIVNGWTLTALPPKVTITIWPNKMKDWMKI